jgi:Tfp pilus assembly protein PilF
VLEGSIRKEGDRVRVTAQLIRVSDNNHLWSETFDRDLKSIFAIQEEIARAIVNKLRVQLAGGNGRPLVKRATEDIEAYNLYYQGKHFYYRLTRVDKPKAVEMLQRAIEKDPGYAAAYAALAVAHSSIPAGMAADPVKVKAAVERALQLDDSLAEAHVALAKYKERFEYDWPGSRQEYERALQLNPNDVYGHINYSNNLILQGHFDAGLREAENAVQLDPLSPEAHYYRSNALFFMRRYDDVIQEGRKLLSIDPGYIREYMTISRCYSQRACTRKPSGQPPLGHRRTVWRPLEVGFSVTLMPARAAGPRPRRSSTT